MSIEAHSESNNALRRLPKLGDTVKTDYGYVGIVKYIGIPQNKVNTYIGLELSDCGPFGPRYGDGTVKNKRYFRSRPGYAYFIKPHRLIQNFGYIHDNTIDLVYGFCRNNYSSFPSNIVYYSMPDPVINVCREFHGKLINFKVGDRIKLFNGKTGYVRYIGYPSFADEEELVGIELDVSSMNATSSDMATFKSTPGSSHFVRRANIISIIVPFDIKTRFKTHYAKLQGLTGADAEYNGSKALVKGFDRDDATWKVAIHGTGLCCHSLWVRFGNLDPIIDDSETSLNENKKALNSMPEIGDKVRTREGKYGTVKYVGSVAFPSPIGNVSNCIGLALEIWDPNGNNGIVSGHIYFKVNAGYGYFVTLNDLIENLGGIK